MFVFWNYFEILIALFAGLSLSNFCNPGRSPRAKTLSDLLAQAGVTNVQGAFFFF